MKKRHANGFDGAFGLRIKAALLSTALVIGSAAVPLHAQSSTANADAMDLLTVTIAQAEEAANRRWAFTMTYTDNTAEAPKTYSVRFDPTRPENDRWIALSPTMEELSKEERKSFKSRLKNANDADGMLVYDGLAKALPSARLLSDDGEKAIFAAVPADEEMPEKMREKLEMSIYLDKESGFVSQIDVNSTGSFKPAPVAKVEEFSAVQRYEMIPEFGLPLLVRADNSVSGEAMFQDFRQDTTSIYSDFVAIDMSSVDADMTAE